MNSKVRTICLFAVVAAVAVLAVASVCGDTGRKAEIRLIIRADDIGSSHTANLACIDACTKGIATSVEVMVPCPWFEEAAKMLRANPGCDAGVHLTLTSEWEFYKWGPITQSPSLVDARGHFFPRTSRSGGADKNDGFLQCGWKIDEVERELRAQIELALKEIPNVTHLSSHMGTPTSSPELRALVERLSAEYKLPWKLPEATRRTPRWGPSDMTGEQRIERLVQIMEELEPGLYLLVEHPGYDTQEMRAIGHEGYRNVASHRDAVTKAFTSEKVKKVIEKRKIKLVSYGDVLGG